VSSDRWASTTAEPSLTRADDRQPAPADVPALHVEGITKAFSGNVVLNQVTLTVLPGEIHCLLGENGAGKSSLLKVITGALTPDQGTIEIGGQRHSRLTPDRARSLGIAAVYQELSLFPHLTVAENIFVRQLPTRLHQRDDAAMRATLQQLASEYELELNPDAVVGDLSLAEQQLVEFAKALIAKPRVLILDEATSALAQHQVEILFRAVRKLRDAGTAIIFVSHRLSEIFELCDRITVLKNGEHVATLPVSEAEPDRLIQLMTGRPVELVFPPKPPVEEVLQRPVVLSVQRLSSGHRFSDVSFELHQGEILGLGGLQGQGQRELLRSLFGVHDTSGIIQLDAANGSISSPRSAIAKGIAYVPEDRKTEGLLLPKSVRENIALPNLRRLTRWRLLSRGQESTLVSNLIQELQVRTRSPKQPVVRLSGGNQQKVVMAKWLPREPRILLLAEPTRGIDVGTKQEIYHLLRQLAAQGTSMILISSDTIELLGLSDRILVLYERRPVAMLSGDEITEENLVRASLLGGSATSDNGTTGHTRQLKATQSASRPASSSPASQSEARRAAQRASRWRTWREAAPITAVMLLLAVVYAVLSRESLSLQTVNNLLVYLLPLLLASMAQALIMITGGIDLSIGAMMTLGSAILVTRMGDSPVSMIATLALVAGVGLVLGACNGALVSLARLPAIIVTLATSFVWTGFALAVLPRASGHLPRDFSNALKHQLGGVVPVSLLVLVGAVILWTAIKRSRLGLSIYALGDNPGGAYISGIPLHRTRIAAYTLAGLLTMLAAAALAGYTGTSDPTIGPPYTLMSITAAVLGGVSFLGGQGVMRGVIAGALTYGFLTQILTISGFDPSYQRVVQGMVLIVALGIRALGAYRLSRER